LKQASIASNDRKRSGAASYHPKGDHLKGFLIDPTNCKVATMSSE
jgi:hypothetical protein